MLKDVGTLVLMKHQKQMERDIFEFIEIWYNRKEGIQL
jgi:hypothetical protein